MISSTGSHSHIDTLARASAPVPVTASVPDQDTVLAPSQTVQQNSTGDRSAKAENDNAPSFISLSTDVVTTLQGGEAQADEVQNRPPPPPPPSQESSTESATGLSEAEQTQVDALSARDQEVRNHERAHASAGGQLAGAPSFEYETGPNGQQYAVGGEVQIDTAAVSGDPEATIAKMETVIRAALAPAEPSGQDKAVAAAASQRKAEAVAELNATKQAERAGETTEENAEPASFDPVEPSSGTSFVDPASGSGSADSIINIIA